MKYQIFFTCLFFLLIYQTGPANLLQNPAFDFWLDDSTPSNWVVEYRTYAGVFKETGTIHSTPFSACLVRRQTGTGNNRGLRQRIPVTPSVTYTLSAWFYDNHNQANGGIVLTWRRTDSSFISSTSTVYTQDTAVWQLLTLTGRAPDNPPDSVAAFVDVLLRTYGFTGSQPNGFIFVDDVEFDISAINEPEMMPQTSEYFVGSPNPFSTRYRIIFNLNQTAAVNLSLYDNFGRQIKKLFVKNLNPGSYSVHWDGTDENGCQVMSGIYYGVLKKNRNLSQIKKIIFQRR